MTIIQELVAELLLNPTDGKLQNDLLEQVYQEKSLEALLPLLAPGASESVLLAGLFVVEELGARATGQFALVRPLGLEPSPFVRARVADIAANCWRDVNDSDLRLLAGWLDSDEPLLVRRSAFALRSFLNRLAGLLPLSGGVRQNGLADLLVGREWEPISSEDRFVWVLGMLASGRSEQLGASGSEVERRMLDRWSRLESAGRLRPG